MHPPADKKSCCKSDGYSQSPSNEWICHTASDSYQDTERQADKMLGGYVGQIPPDDIGWVFFEVPREEYEVALSIACLPALLNFLTTLIGRADISIKEMPFYSYLAAKSRA